MLSPKEIKEQVSLPLPEPVPDLATYEKERDLCLSKDERKRANYDLYMKSQRRSAEPDYLPIKLDVENVSRCNFKCTMCQVTDWDKGKRAEDMDLAAFKKMIDEQYGLVEIKIQGIGEPFMQGQNFIEMVKYARERNIWVRTSSNGSLLHLKDNYKKVIDAGINEIQISVDGATKEVFEVIRKGSKFEQVVKNCKSINDYCKEKGVVRTKMWTVVQKKNIHQLKDFIHLAHDVGFSTMVFSFELTDWGDLKWQDTNSEESASYMYDEDMAWELYKFGEELGVKVAFWNYQSKYDTDKVETLCPWPFERAFLASDMRVVPCCMIGNPDTFEIHDSKKEVSKDEFSFLDTWSGENYSKFRKAHLDGDLPKICKNCYLNKNK